MIIAAFDEELLGVQPADPFMDQGVVADHCAGVRLPLSGAVGQVIDVNPHVLGRELLHQNITRETDEGRQRIAVSADGLGIQAHHSAVEQEGISCTV